MYMYMRNRFWFADSSLCPPPPGRWWTSYSVYGAKLMFDALEQGLYDYPIEVIAVDTGCDKSGEPFINLLLWLEKTGRNYPIYINGKQRNPEMVKKMREIIKRNNWVELSTYTTCQVLVPEVIIGERFGTTAGALMGRFYVLSLENK